MLPCLLMNQCQNAGEGGCEEQHGAIAETKAFKASVTPETAAVVPSRAAVPLHMSVLGLVPPPGGQQTWAGPGSTPRAGNHPASTCSSPARQCHELMGAWSPFPGAGQWGTTAQTSGMFSCSVIGRFCLRDVLKDYQPWVDWPSVQTDLAVTSQFEESKPRMINKEWLMINECPEYRTFFYSSWIIFLLQLDTVLY